MFKFIVQQNVSNFLLPKHLSYFQTGTNSLILTCPTHPTGSYIDDYFQYQSIASQLSFKKQVGNPHIGTRWYIFYATVASRRVGRIPKPGYDTHWATEMEDDIIDSIDEVHSFCTFSVSCLKMYHPNTYLLSHIIHHLEKKNKLDSNIRSNEFQGKIIKYHCIPTRTLLN